MRLRVATFNLNNLFDRFNFHAQIPDKTVLTMNHRCRAGADDLESPYQRVSIETSPMGQLIKPKPDADFTALVARAKRLNADILAVQEVENLAALREFAAALGGYRYLALVEGNDNRMIDVAILSKLPIRRVSSHRWTPDPANPGRYVFSRDLVATEIAHPTVANRTLVTVWNTHLKSKFLDPRISDPDERQELQAQNSVRRTRQADAAAEIIAAHHSPGDHYLLVGDMNDHPGSEPLQALTRGSAAMVDVFADASFDDAVVDFENVAGVGPKIRNQEDLPSDQNWTSRLSNARAADTYERLDHIYASPNLPVVDGSARIQRRTHWTRKRSGSDHDPVMVELNFTAEQLAETAAAPSSATQMIDTAAIQELVANQAQTARTLLSESVTNASRLVDEVTERFRSRSKKAD